MPNQNIVEIIVNAIDNTKSGLQSPITNLESLSKSISKASAFFGIGTVAAAVYFSELINHSIESAAKLELLSQKTGVSVESLSTLGYAAGQTGIDIDALGMGLKKLSTAMYQTEQGNAKTQATFQALGISVANTDGTLKTQEQVMLQVANAFSKMQDGAAKSAIAVQLFGKSGVDLIPFLNQGAAGIEELQTKARNLGLEISGTTAGQAHDFENSVKDINAAFTGMGNSIAADVLPTLVDFAHGIVGLLQPGQALRIVLDGIGAVLGGAFKFGAIVVDLVIMEFQKMANVLATIGVSLTDLFSGNFKQSVRDIGIGFKENEKIGDDFGKKVHNMVYGITDDVKKFGTEGKHAFDVGGITPAKQMAQAINQLKKSFAEAHPQMAAYFNEMDELSKKTGKDIRDITMGAITALGKAIQTDLAKSLEDLVMGAKSFSAAMDELFQGLIKSIIDYVAQMIAATVAQKVMGLLGEAVLGSSTAASIAAGGLVAGAWASPAALVSLASFGANAGPATAALVSTSGVAHSLAAFESGSDFINQTGPALLHAGERVVPAKTNQDLTKALQGGGAPSMVHVHLMLGKKELASEIIDLKRLGFL